MDELEAGKTALGRWPQCDLPRHPRVFLDLDWLGGPGHPQHRCDVGPGE